MSVLIPDLEVFNLVQRKVNTFQFRKAVDINYCQALSMSESDSMKFARQLLEICELSYNAHYEPQGKPYLNEFLVFGSCETISTLQLLRYLRAIKYNIEVETIKQGVKGYEGLSDEDCEHFDSKYGETLEKLNDGITELMARVISELTDYNKLPRTTAPKKEIV